jgi:hypothetical protein
MFCVLRVLHKKKLKFGGDITSTIYRKNLKIHLGEKFCIFSLTGPSQRPRCLRHGSAAALLLGLQVRIPKGHGYLSVVCCVLSGRVLCYRPITPPEDCYRVWCVWGWSRSLDNEQWGGLGPVRLSCHEPEKYLTDSVITTIIFRLIKM